MLPPPPNPALSGITRAVERKGSCRRVVRFFGIIHPSTRRFLKMAVALAEEELFNLPRPGIGSCEAGIHL
jgi:hypothetical protein